MLTILKSILALPLFVTIDIFRSERPGLRKILYFLLTVIFLFSAWIAGYTQIFWIGKSFLYGAGFLDKLTNVSVVGDSMLPTIKSGSYVHLHSPQKYGLERGDIVSFKNVETGGYYYLKRIVGLPQEKISIRNGYVTINGKILQENYVLNNLPTYGNTFLTECNLYTIPKDHYLVLGDNRTVSLDSRVVGFISKNDVEGVIKTNTKENFIGQQQGKEILKSTIDEPLLLEKINDQRKNQGLQPLTKNTVLEEAAKARSESIKKFFDDWKKSAVPLSKILQEKNYKYNSAYEFVTFGYLDEKSIVEQILESSSAKMAFLSSSYKEIGIGTIEKDNQECTFPIISIIVGWSSTPSYSQETVDYWKNEEKVTKETLSVLKGLIGRPGYNQNDLADLIKNITEMSDITTQMNQKINNNEWVDPQEVNRYTQLVDETELKLNSFVKSTQPKGSKTQGAQTFSQKTIENGITAKINSVESQGDKIKIKVTFANVSSNNNVTIAPIRLTMRSKTLGTADGQAPLSLTLSPGQLRSFDLTYEKLSDPPFRFIYTNSAGEGVELGTYTP